MQRGHHPRRRARSRDQHLLREESRGRMWHGVVRVDDVEADCARHLDDLVGEREQVLRLAEQRISRACAPVEREAAWNSPSRNGVSPADEWTLWPRAASTLPSSVATMPLPPTEA